MSVAKVVKVSPNGGELIAVLMIGDVAARSRTFRTMRGVERWATKHGATVEA